MVNSKYVLIFKVNTVIHSDRSKQIVLIQIRLHRVRCLIRIYMFDTHPTDFRTLKSRNQVIKNFRQFGKELSCSTIYGKHGIIGRRA